MIHCRLSMKLLSERHVFRRRKVFSDKSHVAAASPAAGYTGNMSLHLNVTEPGHTGDWAPVNDGVMGGLSQSRFALDAEGVARFEGMVSLENNGGFASVRHRLRQRPSTQCRQIRLHALGDGHMYKLALRTDDTFDGISYQADFLPASHQWMDIDLGLDQFMPMFRGRAVTAPPLTSGAQIQQIGLMIANRQAGAFCLKLRSISFI